MTKKELATLGISGTALGVSSMNLATNLKRRKDEAGYQKEQLKALAKLTNNLDKVDKSLKNIPRLEDEMIRLKEQEAQLVKYPKKKKRRGLFMFAQKNNSKTLDYAGRGALLGAGGATGFLKLIPNHRIGGELKSVPKTFKNKKGKTEIIYKDGKPQYEKTWEADPDYKYPKFQKFMNMEDKNLRNTLVALGGVAIGATLGAIVGAIVDASNVINRKTTVNNRLMKDVVDNLKRIGFKEGEEFTRDPKRANILKTKVCLVISRSSDELRLLINTVNDRKLNDLTKGFTKNLPNYSTVTEKVSDRYNELSITTTTSNKGDAGWVSSIAEKYIREGYPVYLVEVG